jgi:uncharacterized repeat protein (TIGR01451 family)
MTNTGTAAMTDVRYRRVMDWDVEPTAFSEWVTIQDPGKSSHLRFDSDDGFASASPLAGPTYIDSESVCGTGYTGPCTFTDLGSGGTFPTVTTPDDHGSLFDFGFGSLAVGQSKSFRIYYGATTSESSAVSALTAGGAEVYSLGESNCPEANPDSGNATNCSSEPANSGVKFGTPVTFIFGFVTSTADVSISKSVSPSKAVVGNNLTYTLAVHNNGPDPAAGVNVTDKLPTGVSFVSASTTQGTCSGTSTVTCSLGSIASGGNATVKIVARATATGKVTNTATVSTPSSDTNQSNNSSTVTSTVVAKAPPPKAKAAKISISGVPRACFASSTTIKVKLKSKSRIVSAVVKLDGKRIKKTTKKQFTVVLNAGRIHSGRHTLQVSVLNGAGKRSSRKVHVTRCAPPKVVVPRFTG